MSELGNIIRHLRGDDSQETLGQRIGLNSRTIQRAENGAGLKLGTLRQISKHFKLDKTEHAALLLAWLRVEWRDEEIKLFDIRIRKANGQPDMLSDADKFLETFRSVPARYQKELMRAAERKEVLRAIGPINELWEKWDKLKNPAS